MNTKGDGWRMWIWGLVTAALVAACGETGESPAAAIAAARATWLTGDLDGAIAALAPADGDPHARALLARAYDIAGKPFEARQAIAGLPKLAPHIVPDTSTVAQVALSGDGALIAIVNANEREVRVFDVVTGRQLFAVPGDAPAFAIAPRSRVAVLAVSSIANDGVAIHDAWTGAKRRQLAPIQNDYLRAFAIDARGVVTLLGHEQRLVQRDLEWGGVLREIPLRLWTTGPLRVARDSHTLLLGSQILDADATRLTTVPEIGDAQLSVDGTSLAIASPAGELSIEEPDGTLRAHLEAGKGGAQLQWLADDTLLAITASHVRHLDRAGKLLGETDLPDVAKPPFATGVGGQLVAHGISGELLVYALGRSMTPRLISRFGGATRATALAWSPDGTSLAIASTNRRVATWVTTRDVFTAVPGLPSYPTNTLGALTYDASGALSDTGPAHARFDYFDSLVFAYPPGEGDKPTRYWKLPTAVAMVSQGGDRVAALDRAGAIHVLDARTGEGLGELGTVTDDHITGIAMRPDGKTLAIARVGGGIALWDLAARGRVLELTGGHAFAAVDARGAVGGDLSLIAWSAGDTEVHAAAAGAVAGAAVASTALAKPPAPVAFTPTPAPHQPPRGCLVAGASIGRMTLAGDALAFCGGTGTGDPETACFTADLAAHTIAPVPTPAAALVALFDDTTGDPHAIIKESADGAQPMEVCAADAPTTCHRVPSSRLTRGMAVSDDATVFALDQLQPPGWDADDDVPSRVETWNAVTGTRIARFDVRCPDHTGTSRSVGCCELELVGHTLMAYQMPCAFACSIGKLYSMRGKFLGDLAVEASTLHVQHFHDDLYVLRDSGAGQMPAFVVQDMATAKVVLERHDDARWAVRTTPDRIVRVVAASRAGPGRVEIWGRDLTLRAAIEIPPCVRIAARP